MTDGLFKIRPGAPVTSEGERSNVEILHQPAHRRDGDLHPDGDRRGSHHRARCPSRSFRPSRRRKCRFARTTWAPMRRPSSRSVATPIEQQMSGVDNLNYMYSLNAAGNGQMTMIVDFDVKTDPNTDLMLTQMRETQAASQLPAGCDQLRRDGAEVGHGAADGDGPLFAERHLRRQIPGELRLHQSERSADARSRHRQRAGVRRGPVCHAAVGEAGPARQARHHGARNRLRDSGAEHRESRGAGRRRACSRRARSTPTRCARRAA